MLLLSLQAKDEKLPRIQNTSQNPKTVPQKPKHVPESKNTSQDPKHVPESKNTSQDPKHFPKFKTLPRIQNTSQNPKTLPQKPKHVPESKNTLKHFRILGRVLDSGSVLSLSAMVCSGSFFTPPPEPPGEQIQSSNSAETCISIYVQRY